jgi:hypothetical protein
VNPLRAIHRRRNVLFVAAYQIRAATLNESSKEINRPFGCTAMEEVLGFPVSRDLLRV